jgi:AraC-like DNA-binding protein
MNSRTRVDEDKSWRLLREKLLTLMPNEGNFTTRIPGFVLHRFNADSTPRQCMYKAVIVVVVQGRKWSKIGEEEYIYSQNSCFVSGMDMPVTSCIQDISPDRPYLSLSLDLDNSLITHMAAEIAHELPPESDYARGAAVQKVDAELLDAFLRLMELVESPGRETILAPLILKEIHYRLLTGPMGGQLRAIYTFGTQGNQIARAVSWLMKNYTEPFQVDELAGKLNIATSTLHKHFKEVTTVSPLQFQKRLRLLAAQRLMLNGVCDATQASVQVGYESLTQFNREYKRMFGEPPRRDINRLKAEIPQMENRALSNAHA